MTEISHERNDILARDDGGVFGRKLGPRNGVNARVSADAIREEDYAVGVSAWGNQERAEIVDPHL